MTDYSKLISQGREAEAGWQALRPILERKRAEVLERLSLPASTTVQWQETQLVALLQAYRAIEDEFKRDIQAGHIAERQAAEEAIE